METEAIFAGAGSRLNLDLVALEQQFDRIIAANGASLARLASSYTNSTSDRDDLLQEIALAIWQALPRFRNECSERTFAFRIAHNRAFDYLARTRNQSAALNEDLEVPDPGLNPETGLAQEEGAERLRRAVRKLPLAYRQVTVLTLEGLGYAEIAEILGITESNVGARLSRARQALREELENKR